MLNARHQTDATQKAEGGFLLRVLPFLPKVRDDLHDRRSQANHRKSTIAILTTSLRSGRRRIHETAIERQDAGAIHRLTPRRSWKTIATMRAFVNKHIPRGYDECLVWGTIGWANNSLLKR